MIGRVVRDDWSWNGMLIGGFVMFCPRHYEGPCRTDQWSRTSFALVAPCSKGMLASGVRSLVQFLRVRAWLTLEEHTALIFPKVEDSGVSYPWLFLEGRTSWRLGWNVWGWCHEGLGALPVERGTGHRGLLRWLRLWWTDPTSVSAFARRRRLYLNSCTLGSEGPSSSLVDVRHVLSTAGLHHVAFS